MKALAEEKHNQMMKHHEKQMMPPRPPHFEDSGKQTNSYGKRANRNSNGLNSGLVGASTEVSVSEFDSNHRQQQRVEINPFSEVNFNVEEQF